MYSNLWLVINKWILLLTINVFTCVAGHNYLACVIDYQWPYLCDCPLPDLGVLTVDCIYLWHWSMLLTVDSLTYATGHLQVLLGGRVRELASVGDCSMDCFLGSVPSPSGIKPSTLPGQALRQILIRRLSRIWNSFTFFFL